MKEHGKCPAAAFLTLVVAAAGMAGANYHDLLDFHGMPRSAADRGFNIFFDEGAWQGYSLPATDDAGTGFSGPFVHSLGMGEWAGVRFAAFVLRGACDRQDMVFNEVASHAVPAALERTFSANSRLPDATDSRDFASLHK